MEEPSYEVYGPTLEDIKKDIYTKIKNFKNNIYTYDNIEYVFNKLIKEGEINDIYKCSWRGYITFDEREYMKLVLKELKYIKK